LVRFTKLSCVPLVASGKAERALRVNLIFLIIYTIGNTRGLRGREPLFRAVGVGGEETRTQVCDAIAGRRSGLSDGAGKDKYASRMTNGNRGDTDFVPSACVRRTRADGGVGWGPSTS
jgi:hypothetical protein